MVSPRARVIRRPAWLAASSGAVFAALAIHAAAVDTPTVDEAAHLPAGVQYLETGEYDLYLKNPPLWKQLIALPAYAAGAIVPEADVAPGGWGPWVYAARFQRENPRLYLVYFFLGRCVVIACTLLCGALLYRFARHLADARAAAASTALFFLNPTVIAHGHLATIDIATATTMLATVLAVRHAYRGPARGPARGTEPGRESPGAPARIAFAGALFGVALLVKFTALLLAPGLAVLVLWERRRVPLRAAGDLLLAAACALVVVNLGMAGRGSFSPLSALPLESRTATALQEVLPGALPIPLPRTWVIGLDAQAVDAEHGEFGSYLFGEWSEAGWWYYNVVAFCVKTPIPTLLALLVAPLAWRRRAAWPELLYVFAPLVALVPVLLFGNRLNVGVRYLLPVLPFALAGCAPVWRWLEEQARPVRLLPAAAVAAQLASVLSVHPAHIAYFNALAGGSENGHRVLADSNLDWGQDLHRLPDALAALGFSGRPSLLYFGSVEPSLYGIDFQRVPITPTRGVVVVSANFALGAEYLAPTPAGGREWIDRAHTDWLRKRTPDLRAGSLWIYDLRPGRKRAATREGLVPTARDEGSE